MIKRSTLCSCTTVTISYYECSVGICCFLLLSDSLQKENQKKNMKKKKKYSHRKVKFVSILVNKTDVLPGEMTKKY